MMLSQGAWMFNSLQLFVPNNIQTLGSKADVTFDIVPALKEFIVLLIEARLLSSRPVLYCALMVSHHPRFTGMEEHSALYDFFPLFFVL